jgi:hypothetical protein
MVYKQPAAACVEMVCGCAYLYFLVLWNLDVARPLHAVRPR